MLKTIYASKMQYLFLIGYFKDFIRIFTGFFVYLINESPMRGKTKIAYTDGFYIDRDSEGNEYKMVITKYYTVTNMNTRQYHNCLYLLMSIDGCPRNLIDYLSEKMDSNNIVYNTIETRKGFIEFVEHISKGAMTYSDHTVKKAFLQLCHKNLLLSKGKSRYQVNPEYLFKGEESKRIELIKQNLTYTQEIPNEL